VGHDFEETVNKGYVGAGPSRWAEGTRLELADSVKGVEAITQLELDEAKARDKRGPYLPALLSSSLGD
jgi:hypothetical protein